jgi:hypothetical protein
VERVSTTGHDATAGLAAPDADSSALDVLLSAERAHVLGVLLDLELLDLLAKGRTVTGTVLAGNADLLRALSLKQCERGKSRRKEEGERRKTVLADRRAEKNSIEHTMLKNETKRRATDLFQSRNPNHGSKFLSLNCTMNTVLLPGFSSLLSPQGGHNFVICASYCLSHESPRNAVCCITPHNP